MSGGHFDYIQFNINDTIEKILYEIQNRKVKPDWVSDECWHGKRWSDKTIDEFVRATKILNKAFVYINRIDWLLSGDDGEETFHKRLKEDLEQLTRLKIC